MRTFLTAKDLQENSDNVTIAGYTLSVLQLILSQWRLGNHSISYDLVDIASQPNFKEIVLYLTEYLKDKGFTVTERDAILDIEW